MVGVSNASYFPDREARTAWRRLGAFRLERRNLWLALPAIGLFILAVLSSADAFVVTIAGFKARPIHFSLVALLPFVALVLYRTRWRTVMPPLGWPIAAFLTLGLVLLVTRRNPFGFSNIAILLSYVCSYYAIVTLANTRPRYRALLNGLLFSGVAVSLVGMAQLALFQLGRAVTFFPTQTYHLVYDHRASSIFLEPDYFGIFASLPALFGLVLALSAAQTKWWRITYASIFVVNTAGVLVSGTRSAYLGMAAGIAVLVLVSLSQRGQLARRLPWIGGMLAAVAIVGGVALALDLPAAHSAKERFRILFSATEGASAVRIQSTVLALLLATDRPFIGYGPGYWTQLQSRTREDGYFIDGPKPMRLEPGYYSLHVLAKKGVYNQGATPVEYPEIAFVSSSTGSTKINRTPGTYQIRLGYDVVKSESEVVPFTRESYPNGQGVEAAPPINDWRNSLIHVREPILLRQIGFANGNAGERWELRRSTSTGEWGDMLAYGEVGTSWVNRVLPAGPNGERQKYTGNLLSDVIVEYGIAGMMILAVLFTATFGGLLRAMRRVEDERRGWVEGSIVVLVALLVSTAFTQVFFFSFFWVFLGAALAAARVANVTPAAALPRLGS
ncbi:MAG: O-antigen ligase family protein [Chloroflexi bacterium]|nr:O-antigen ligase family protein [Chloroflexota bacterium]